MKRITKLFLIFGVLIFLIVFAIANHEGILREHLVNATPSLTSLEKRLDATDKNLKTLTTEFNQMKAQAQAQSSQAAAAKASIDSFKKS